MLDVFQAMLSEITEDEAITGLLHRVPRQDHLPTGPRRGDASRQMQLATDITRFFKEHRPGVYPHAHLDRPAGKRLLCSLGGGERIRGALEHHEEGVPLGAYLHPSVSLPRMSAQTVVLGQDPRIPLVTDLE